VGEESSQPPAVRLDHAIEAITAAAMRAIEGVEADDEVSGFGVKPGPGGVAPADPTVTRRPLVWVRITVGPANPMGSTGAAASGGSAVDTTGVGSAGPANVP